MSYASEFAFPFKIFQWSLENGFPAGEFARIVGHAVATFAKNDYRDLADQFPFQSSSTQVSLSSEFFCAIMESIPGGVATGSEIRKPEDLEMFARVAEQRPNSHEDLVKLLGSEWFSADRFVYVGPFKKPFACYQHVLWHLGDWLKNYVIPDVLERNRKRIDRAIPLPPQFNTAAILGSLWVLESVSEMRSGTGFNLKNSGIVTADHVLAPDLVAFRADNPTDRFPVSIAARNSAIDLAIVQIGAAVGFMLEKGVADNLRPMDHLLVAGFPNYRLGDSGLVSPGLVSGFRTVSGIRRILTNTPIIAGNSGGPVVGADGRVIGVAVTGADAPEAAHTTENHGIVPIDALSHL